MVFRRMLGFVILLIGLLGLALSIAGEIYSRRFIDHAGRELEKSLALTSQSLGTVQETLRLAQTAASQANDGLDTVEHTIIDLSHTISQTRPLLDEVAQVVSHDVPDSLDTLETTVPDIAQAAAIVDDTLKTLSDLRFEQTIFGFSINFDLGIEYAPQVSLEASMNQLGDSLEGIAPRLRGMEVHIETTDSNLETISQDMMAISRDLEVINSSVAQVAPLLDDYVRLVNEANDAVEQTRANLSRQLDAAKWVAIGMMVWLGLTQVAPLYLGGELITGWRSSS